MGFIMTIDEVFENPTVKEVIFQIRYPNLFYIENKIGELQLRIMEVFPNSALLHRRQIVLTDLGPDGEFIKPPDLDEETGKKVWQFESDKGFKLNITGDSLDITSNYHKTYNLDDGSEKFRDIIEFVIGNFMEVMQIPIILRIGLRYIDECPIHSKDNESFSSWYNSSFPLKRFNLSDALEMDFKTVIKTDNEYLRYVESLQEVNGKPVLILDFDGYTMNIKTKDFIEVTDRLHDIILAEYEKTITETVKDYMRDGKNES